MTTTRVRIATLLAAMLASAGCNALLGIDALPDQQLETDASSVSASPGRLDAGSSRADAGSSDTFADAALPRAAVPHAWAEWPMPNPKSSGLPHVQTYSFETDGVVKDEVTGLAWQRSVDERSFTWADAASYCKQLPLAGGGFRLPTRIELISIVDYTSTNPTIDVTAFPGTPAARFWSASPFAGAANEAWLVGFEFGAGFAFNDEVTEKHRVRCVR